MARMQGSIIFWTNFQNASTPSLLLIMTAPLFQPSQSSRLNTHVHHFANLIIILGLQDEVCQQLEFEFGGDNSFLPSSWGKKIFLEKLLLALSGHNEDTHSRSIEKYSIKSPAPQTA